MSIDDIHGGLSIRAGSAQLAVNAGTSGMQINEFTITGDPDLVFTGAGPFISPAFNSDGGKVQINTSSDTVNGAITFTGAINTTPTAVGGAPTVSGGRLAIACASVTVQDIDTNSLTAAGGEVYIFSQGNIAAGSILTSSNVGASIVLSAGNSGVGNLVAGSLASQSFVANAIGGSIILTSAGNLTTSNVLSSGFAGANGLGGQVVAVAGQGGSPASISMGTINTQAGTIPGQVLIINMGDGGSVTTGSITTRSQLAGNGADISITSAGAITTGAILTQALGPGFGGDVWLSSGAASGTAITTASITRTGISGSGEIFALINPGVAANLGVVTGALNGADFVGTPTSPQASITGDITLSVTAGAVSGFNPGGFTSINAPAGIITLSQPVRVPAPIVSRTGGLTIGSIAGALPQAQTLTLVSPGGISVSSLPTIQTGVFRAISTLGSITLPNVNMSGGALPGGAIGVVASRGITVPASSTLSTNGVPIAGPIGLISPAGSVNIAGAVSSVLFGQTTIAALTFVNVTGTVTAGTRNLVQLNVVLPVPASPTVSAAAATLAPTASSPVPARTIAFADLGRLPSASISLLGIPTDRINFDFPALVPLETNFEAIAYTSPALVTAARLVTLNSGDVVTKFLSGSQVSLAGATVTVISGEAIVQATRETIIRAAGNELALRPGAVVIVSVDHGTVKFYNVWEVRTKSATVAFGKQDVGLGAGDEIIIGADHEAIIKTISSDGIGRRKLSWLQTTGREASLSEFSLLCLLQTSKVMNQLMKSTSSDDRSITKNALKMTACLMQSTRGHGNYSNRASAVSGASSER